MPFVVSREKCEVRTGVGTVYRRENELSITKRSGGEEREKPVFDSWNYQHYFWFVSMKGEKNISVYCKL